MNSKKLDCSKSSRGEKPKDPKKNQNKQDTAMVGVGMKKTMKSGCWSKKPDQKAIYISSPAQQPYRKGPIRSKTTQGYNKNQC